MGIYTSFGKGPSSSEELLAYNMLLELKKESLFEDFKPYGIEKGLAANCYTRDIFGYHFSNSSSKPYGYHGDEWVALFFMSLYVNFQDFPPNLFARHFYESIACRDIYYNTFRDIKEALDVANRLVKESSFFKKDLSFSLEYEYPEYADSFQLPWECIEFTKGGLYLWHPNHIGDDFFPPFFYRNPEASEELNETITEAYKSKWIIWASFRNGRITRAEMIADFTNKIKVESKPPIIIEDTPDDNFSEESINRCVEEIKDQVSSRSHYNANKIKDSNYFKFLASRQLNDIPFRFCTEVKVNSSAPHLVYYEDAILFTIKKNNKHTILVYENANFSRSSYIFSVSSSKLTESTSAILDFFSSGICNKREKIQYNSIDFKDMGIIACERLKHDYYKDWKYLIKYYSEQLIK